MRASSNALDSGLAQLWRGIGSFITVPIVRQSHMLSYIDDFRWLAVICFVVIPLAILLKWVTATEPVTAH